MVVFVDLLPCTALDSIGVNFECTGLNPSRTSCVCGSISVGMHSFIRLITWVPVTLFQSNSCSSDDLVTNEPPVHAVSIFLS